MFSEYPFLRILIPFALGISASNDIPQIKTLVLLTLLISILSLEKINPTQRWKYRKSIGVLLQFQLFLLGCNYTTFQKTKHIINVEKHEYVVHLVQLDYHGEKYNRFISHTYYKTKNYTTQKFMSYTYLPSSLTELTMGDVILTNKKPTPIYKTYNPGSFDFASFAYRNNIHYSIFIGNNNEWVKLTRKRNLFSSILFATRKWILNTIQKKITNPIEAGLTEALLIGYKEDLDQQLQEQYTITGVSHIIAVSGMHLGLIFSVLVKLFDLFSRRWIMRYFGFGIILPLLWVFALISGASASVLRSVMVFSIVLFGNLLLKKSSSLNALFASAVVLLIIKPSYISDIGFQLSYAAVLSILIYEPIISKWLYLKNKILKQVWNVVAITLSAQVLTTPIVLFHFKQIPLLFLITNMVAVPLSNCILLMAILLCGASLLMLPTTPLVFLIQSCIQTMNYYINKIANIPFNATHIHTTLPITILLFGAIASLTYFLYHIKKSSLIPFLIIQFLLLLFYQIEQYRIKNIKRILILQVKNATCIVHQHGHYAIFIGSEHYMTNQKKLKKQLHILGNELGISRWEVKQLKNEAVLIDLNKRNRGKRVILLSALSKSNFSLKKLKLEKNKTTQLIADGSTQLWKIKQLEKQAQEVHLRLHSTPEKGAFILSCENR